MTANNETNKKPNVQDYMPPAAIVQHVNGVKVDLVKKPVVVSIEGIGCQGFNPHLLKANNRIRKSRLAWYCYWV